MLDRGDPNLVVAGVGDADDDSLNPIGILRGWQQQRLRGAVFLRQQHLDTEPDPAERLLTQMSETE
jgi:hypothetical protein